MRWIPGTRPFSDRLRPAAWILAAAVWAALGSGPPPAAGASPTAPAEAPVDTTGLASGPYANLSALLEKTLFQVDVATLTLRVDPATAGKLREVARGHRGSPARADSAAGILFHAPQVLADLRFERTVSLDRFLGGVRGNLERALKAGMIDRARFEAVNDSLPVWFAFLADRKAREGDRIYYRIRPASMRTVYLSRDGRTLLDLLQEDPRARDGVLGSYLAPGSDFRQGLLQSLFRAGSGGAGR